MKLDAGEQFIVFFFFCFIIGLAATYKLPAMVVWLVIPNVMLGINIVCNFFKGKYD